VQEVLHDIDIKLLKIFRVVAKRQSFSLAAEQLNTSPSNISMNMAQLESRLEMRLCERGVKGFSLTEEGQRILDASEELYLAMEQFVASVRLTAEKGQHEFHIGVLGESIMDDNMRISEILADLEGGMPGVSFHLVFESAARLKERVAEGGLHCAIGYFSELSTAYRSRHLYTEIHRCYCGNAHELFGCADDDIDLSQGAMDKYRLAGYDDLTDEERDVIPCLKKFDSYSRTNEGILSLIRTGNYVGLLPESYAKYWCGKGDIRLIDKSELQLPVEIDVIYLAAKEADPALKALLSSIDKFYAPQESG